MCGIVGLITKNGDVSSSILQSLKRLEYRGYDSSGISVIENHKLKIVKEAGKIDNLIRSCLESDVSGNIGLGHTRWATHGKVSKENSHPHFSDHVSVVHNGIIENYLELKEYLISQGEKFKSETDTEVIPVYINFLLKNGESFRDAFSEVIKKLKGAYAIAAICTYNPDLIAIAKNHSPLVIGFGEELYAVGSDAFSVASVAKKLIYLTDGDYGFINSDGKLELFDENHKIVKRDLVISNLNIGELGKDGYKHYMLKEIYEQPVVIKSILNNYIDNNSVEIESISSLNIEEFNRIKIIACGTSYYSASVGVNLIEKYAKINSDAYIASEYRYRDFTVENDTLYIAISQSGETADTIGAIKSIKSQGGKILSIINNEESTMQFLSDWYIKCHAGPEIGVASTKAFTAQITILSLFAIYIAEKRKTLNKNEIDNIIKITNEVPSLFSNLINNKSWCENIKSISNKISTFKSLIYLGRGISCPIASEGSLKMKELSYIHSESMPSGEIKHGPIALIDKNIPVICIVPSDSMVDKSISNIETILTRDAVIVLIGDEESSRKLNKFSNQIIGSIILPKVNDILIPNLYSIPVQLLAYFTAIEKGNDVDQPRNLAKSVTVE